MPKYLLEVSYTTEGIKGVIAKGGSARRAAADEAAKSAGGSIDAFYFAFGSSDVIVIADFPDHVSAAALAMNVSGGGGARVKTTVLLTEADIDQAAGRPVLYTPPGRT